MGLIQTLPTTVVHLIAAGEVIDSLGAVVRELIENSIDAQANRIAISIWTDTLTVQVSDNGQGMTLEDLEQAATPHTTSKIHTETDLHQITSLGFRGEALHSLAQLANLQICSRKPGDTIGWQITYDSNGQVEGEPRTVAIAPGTIVTAKQIFSNRPSRLQALPVISQQLRKIQLQIQQTAIAHPQITWQVNLDDRSWFTLWSGETMQDVLPQMLSSISVNDLVSRQFSELHPSYVIPANPSELTYTSPLASSLSQNTVQINVTLGLPDRVSRRRADWVKVAINGRFVQFPEMEQVIFAKFARTLPRHRYPICVTHLQVPPHHVDWNRQPAKNEVYLHHLNYYQEQLSKAIAQLLEVPEPRMLTSSAAATQMLRTAESNVPYTSSLLNISPKALAQVHNTYILVEHATGLWLVEQHVAHERVLFEQLESQWQIVPLEQPLILKHLSPQSIERLEAIGIEIDAFGEDLWAVRSLPAVLVNCEDLEAAVIELSYQDDPQLTRATIACRAAIRNGTALDLGAMQDLLNQWQKTHNPHTCPHGRPICLSLEETHLARFFRRNWIVNQK